MARTLEDLVIRLSADNADLKRKLNQSESEIRRFSSTTKKSFSDIATSVQTLGSAIAGAFVVREMTQFAQRAVELGSSISDASRRIGILGETLQVIEIQAGDAGVATGTVDSALQSFSKTLGQVQAGIGRASRQLGALDPALLQQLRSVKDVDAGYRAVAAAIQRAADAGDEQRASAIAAATGMGELIGILKDGPAAFDAVNVRAKQSGQILSGEAKDGLDAFDDALDRVKRVTLVGFAEGLAGANQSLDEFAKSISDPANLKGIHDYSQAVGQLGNFLLHLADAGLRALDALVPISQIMRQPQFGNVSAGSSSTVRSGNLPPTSATVPLGRTAPAGATEWQQWQALGGMPGANVSSARRGGAGGGGRGGRENSAPTIFLDVDRAMRGPLDAFMKANDKMVEDLGKTIDETDRMVDDALRETEARAQAFGDFFGSLVQNLLFSSDRDFKALAKSFAASILEMEVRAAASSLFKLGSQKLAGSAGGIGGFIGSILGAIVPHADGGVFSTPHIGLVAERGPEAIIPMDRLARMGGGNVTVNIRSEIPGANYAVTRRPTGEVDIVASLVRREVSRGGMRDEFGLRHAAGRGV